MDTPDLRAIAHIGAMKARIGDNMQHLVHTPFIVRLWKFIWRELTDGRLEKTKGERKK